ncbi:FAD-binding oxidoreductase [Pedobacter changchengzhani]|uniref:FAD-binding oxidoreductase n=1 Tax=Pedobacter changchengzhani TaxID=2529274 RepID=A0A4R5MMV5_9SPHI|nr:FAD-dependent oxidoreductase [Pedobacter changchengzhani]TDG37032.1 FAD-binding oxidoreductase [Pedobacter changchengzhani]
MSSASPFNGNVTVIGGGIIGLCSAFYLQKAGFKVQILEQGDLYSNCSSGNAGMIVPSHFVPLAAPGMITKGIKWMFDSKSPFYVKPSLNPSLISWGLKFWKFATEKHVAASAGPLRDLHLLSKSLYEDLAKEPSLNFSLKEKGILMLYKGKAVGEEEIHLAIRAQKLGLDVEPLTAQQTQDLEPDAELSVLGSVHYRCDAHLSPNDLVNQLLANLKEGGAEIITNCKVNDFEIVNGKINSIITNGKTYKPDLVVMTGGSWLPEMAKKADMSIPIMPGKGYSFMVDETKKIIHPSLLIEAKVAVTPMNGKIRFGGTMEIAPMNDKINLKRVEGIAGSIVNYYPDYNVEVPQVDKIWYGFRPCSPDGLPYIGFSKKISNLIVAGGHGMMGISLAPATGKLVAQLAKGEELATDISMFGAERFN